MMNTKSFLKTNLKEYLNQDHDRCISCAECIKASDRHLSYKYPKQTKSIYDAYHCSVHKGTVKTEAFNLDKERLKMRIPREFKRDFTSHNKATYLPYEVRPKTIMRDNKLPGPDCFLGSTTYGCTF